MVTQDKRSIAEYRIGQSGEEKISHHIMFSAAFPAWCFCKKQGMPAT